MQPDLKSLDLVSIRNLFLKEAREYLVAVDLETPEELKVRLKRINEIEIILEGRKTSMLVEGARF